MNFIVAKFSATEQPVMKKMQKHIAEALEIMITNSLERAISEYNK